jgi:hypothetical protein
MSSQSLFLHLLSISVFQCRKSVLSNISYYSSVSDLIIYHSWSYHLSFFSHPSFIITSFFPFLSQFSLIFSLCESSVLSQNSFLFHFYLTCISFFILQSSFFVCQSSVLSQSSFVFFCSISLVYLQSLPRSIRSCSVLSHLQLYSANPSVFLSLASISLISQSSLIFPVFHSLFSRFFIVIFSVFECSSGFAYFFKWVWSFFQWSYSAVFSLLCVRYQKVLCLY